MKAKVRRLNILMCILLCTRGNTPLSFLHFMLGFAVAFTCCMNCYSMDRSCLRNPSGLMFLQQRLPPPFPSVLADCHPHLSPCGTKCASQPGFAVSCSSLYAFIVGLLCCKHTLLAHVPLSIHQEPPSPSLWGCSQ